MDTVFSHIVQKRFSQVNEDVATDALAFILQSSESARNGLIKLLRGVVADMPELRFRTQQTEGSIRPDMWGFDGVNPRSVQRQLGGTPLWLIFQPGEFGRGLEVHTLLESWAEDNDIIYSMDNGEVAVGLDLIVGEEKDEVARNLVNRLRDVRDRLSSLIQSEDSSE